MQNQAWWYLVKTYEHFAVDSSKHWPQVVGPAIIQQQQRKEKLLTMKKSCNTKKINK